MNFVAITAKTQSVILGDLELGLPFKLIPVWGKKTRHLYLCINQSLDVGCPEKGNMTLSSIVLFRSMLEKGSISLKGPLVETH